MRMLARAPAFVGTAGWTIPKTSAEGFPGAGTHLQRFARALPAAEINSSFYRPHRPSTYTKWAASVPAEFPPSLALAPAVAGRFFAALRERVGGAVVCEPRHPSWFEAAGQDLLAAAAGSSSAGRSG